MQRPSDIKDGALLVPKLVLVAPHCAGRPVIDCNGNNGTLDAVYDEACDLGGKKIHPKYSIQPPVPSMTEGFCLRVLEIGYNTILWPRMPS